MTIIDSSLLHIPLYIGSAFSIFTTAVLALQNSVCRDLQFTLYSVFELNELGAYPASIVQQKRRGFLPSTMRVSRAMPSELQVQTASLYYTFLLPEQNDG